MNKKTSTLREGNNYDKNITVYGNKQGYFAWDKSSPVVRTPLDDEYEITMTSINPHKTGFVDKLKTNIKMKQFKLSQLPLNLQDEIIRILRDFHTAGFQGGLRQYHKNRQDNDLDEGRLNELDKSTLGSYVKKSSADATKRQSKVTGHNEFQKGARTMAQAVYGDKVQRYPDREDSKIAKRQAGLGKAVDRLTRDKDVSEALKFQPDGKGAMKQKPGTFKDDPKDTYKGYREKKVQDRMAKGQPRRFAQQFDEATQDELDQAAISKSKSQRGRDALANKEKTAARNRATPAAQAAKQKIADYHKKNDESVKKLEENAEKKKCPPMSHIKKMCKDGKTVAEICKMHPDCDRAELKQMVADCKKSDSKITKAKKSSGKKIAESYDFLEWDKQLTSLIKEDLTVNITKSSTPGSNSVNVSATGEESEMLMKLIQSAGLGGAELGQSQYRQPVDDSAAVTVEPVMHDEVISSLGDTDIDNGQDAMTFLKHMIQHGQSPVEVDVAGDDCDDYEQEVDESNCGSTQSMSEAEPEDDDYDDEEVCPECDGEGCPECYGDEHVDRAHDHARGMERESVEMDEDEMDEGAGVMHFKNQQAKQSGEKSFKLGDKTFPVKEEDEMDEGAGVMHFKNQQAKQSGEKSFKLGNKTFPVKEADDDITASGNGDNSEEADEVKSDATRDAGLAASYTPESKSESDIVKSLMEKLNKIGKKSTKCNECGSMMEDDHECSSKKLDEWANSPVGQSEDEQFQTSTDFMTKVISGGLNNIKQDQTTLGQGSLRVKTSGEIQDVNLSMGAMLRKLDGIN